MRKRGQAFKLDARTIRIARASRLLALDIRALDTEQTLPLEPPTTELSATVAVVHVEGPIAERAEYHMCGYSDGYDAIAARLDAALDEADSVVLRIQSPGGDFSGMLDAIATMRARVAESGKPVYAFVDGQATSAAYALACVANRGIYGSTMCEVGSIGVIGFHFDESKALEQEGIALTVFKSGKRKDEMNPFVPLTKTATDDMQQFIDEAAQRFADVVAAARGTSAQAILALEGAALWGDKAETANLFDGTKTFDEVMTMAGNDALKGANGDAWARMVSQAPELQGMEHDAAIGAVLAWRSAAASSSELAQKIAVLEAAEAERATKAEGEERRALIQHAIEAGKLAPAAAFADDAKTTLAPAYAEMKLATLRAHVAALPVTIPIAGKTAPVIPAVRAGASFASIPEHERAYLQAHGVTEEQWARINAPKES